MNGMGEFDGGMTIFGAMALLIALAAAAFGLWMNVRILHKAGFSGWWCLVVLLPIVNMIMIWIFAYIDWPNAKRPA